MKPQKKLKIALNETRLLIPGAEILTGFQLESIFQDAFDRLSQAARLLSRVASRRAPNFFWPPCPEIAQLRPQIVP
jgi:hypothetical protein